MPGVKNPDKRQIDFLRFYLDPKSKTFCDAKNSAIKAGFSEQYANNITALMPNWLSEAIGRRKRMLVKAEKNLEDLLEEDVRDQVVTPFGPLFDKKTKQPVMRRNPKIMALKHDASKFIAERLGKKDYSVRQEFTGPDGEHLLSESEKSKIDSIFNENKK